MMEMLLIIQAPTVRDKVHFYLDFYIINNVHYPIENAISFTAAAIWTMEFVHMSWLMYITTFKQRARFLICRHCSKNLVHV